MLNLSDIIEFTNDYNTSQLEFPDFIEPYNFHGIMTFVIKTEITYSHCESTNRFSFFIPDKFSKIFKGKFIVFENESVFLYVYDDGIMEITLWKANADIYFVRIPEGILLLFKYKGRKDGN